MTGIARNNSMVRGRVRAGIGLVCGVALATMQLGGSAAIAAGGVTAADIAASPAGEWLSYGRDYGEQRFSPLGTINAGNVAQLGLAWSADLDTARGQEATPLLHNGVLYVSTAWSMVKAYDATTGKQLWGYDPKVPRETLVRACCVRIT